ncbi:hypothetical protein ECG_03306 [Echinococcus granulosus]|nr:hypothetical protein ECG_03304 [Echinococcus granulosus]KAH9284265.1 hypothetical protein ECG_03307 [Echinococcus granulosus]KAH9284266.1 hypothetical protein ECG_03306 [Echinococcus granulosus]
MKTCLAFLLLSLIYLALVENAAPAAGETVTPLFVMDGPTRSTKPSSDSKNPQSTTSTAASISPFFHTCLSTLFLLLPQYI